jgi:DNA-binding NtrC family response regulator
VVHGALSYRNHNLQVLAESDSGVKCFLLFIRLKDGEIMDMLERTNWNQTEAAERFQIPLSTLNQKIKRLGIETRRRGARTNGAPEPESTFTRTSS